MTLHDGEVEPLTSQKLARAIACFAVCLTVFPSEFRPLASTIGFYERKSIRWVTGRSDFLILECSVPLISGYLDSIFPGVFVQDSAILTGAKSVRNMFYHGDGSDAILMHLTKSEWAQRLTIYFETHAPYRR